MKVFITGPNRKLCKTVLKLCEEAGLKICNKPKAPLQLFSATDCNCAITRVGGIFSGPMEKEIGMTFFAQLFDSKIKVIFVDDQSKRYNSLVARHIAKKNKEVIYLTLFKDTIDFNPKGIVKLIQSRFEV